ncbi:hypothetical protein [Streptomyces pseudovenezuelae]|uniref:hypothetical protein n=1 Tax=Streptomyces pseudovenezuelae TaxID=67350 RepID=UPI002E806DC8|nr:hypothetical protein [Streptomyces pseudovenezuelae]WUA90516.1 hypothetical protein OHO81_25920 [Streptomyces pseudovenezuelae]
MTTVRATPATPPPRLPVRDKASALDRGWGGVSPMLTRLAAERATGILVRERGTLHLADGKVVHAESPAAPGADVLLAAHGTLDPGIWRQALAESVASTGATGTGARRLTGAEAVHRAGRRLVAGGLLTPGALEMCRLTALYDAAYFALAPSSTPGRFRYSTEDGPDAPADVPPEPDGAPGVPHPVPVADLERETLRRRDLLHRIWPDALPDEVPLAREHRPAPPPLPARRQAVLARVDGIRTASEIARELGRPAFHTLVDIRRLVAAGVVSPCLPTPFTEPLAGTPGDGTPVHPVDPHITLLKRLRDALEAL